MNSNKEGTVQEGNETWRRPVGLGRGSEWLGQFEFARLYSGAGWYWVSPGKEGPVSGAELRAGRGCVHLPVSLLPALQPRS